MTLENALQSIPSGLRNPLVEQFSLLLRDYLHSDWEGVGTKAGKFCEIAYCVIDGAMSGNYLTGPVKPSNFPSACDQFQNKYPSASRSLRIQIPKVLISVYEIRNNRAIGHVDPILNPSRMDAEFCLRSTKWIIAELVRHFSGTDVENAAKVVNQVTMENIPMVWEVGTNRRVLDPRLKSSDQVLALLYGHSKPVPVKKLLKWCEYSNSTNFRNKILDKLHDGRLIEFDRIEDEVILSPVGHKSVEDRNLLSLS